MDGDPRDPGPEGPLNRDPDEPLAGQEPDPPRPAKPTLLGEIVQRRSWPLLAVVAAFAMLLAAAPFLFVFERSPYTDALQVLDRLCRERGTDASTGWRDLVATGPAGADPARVRQALDALPCGPRAGTSARPSSRSPPISGPGRSGCCP